MTQAKAYICVVLMQHENNHESRLLADLGGGPAGLYFALLMKKRGGAAHEIEVFERNAPGDTFGWGVVFSGRTLSNLREADVDALRRDCDLVVGADGVNSEVRQRYADAFRPTLGAGRNKYIWYGTRRLFHGLTLTFRESGAGLFAAHSYKFDRATSTFIVECDEQ